MSEIRMDGVRRDEGKGREREREKWYQEDPEDTNEIN